MTVIRLARPVASLITLFAFLLVGRPGIAAQPEGQVSEAPALRLVLDLSVGWLLAARESSAQGSSSPALCSDIAPALFCMGALSLGADWSPVRRASVGLRARWAFDPSTSLGHERAFVEGLIIPQLHSPRAWTWPSGMTARPYLALPLGIAWPLQKKTWTRAVSEDWNGHGGPTIGIATGTEMWLGRRWGVVADLSYQLRFFSADVTSTPFDFPQLQVREHVSYRQQQLLLSAGVLLGL